MACSIGPNIEGVPHDVLNDALLKHKKGILKGNSNPENSYDAVSSFLTLEDWTGVLESLENGKSPDVGHALVASQEGNRQFLSNEINTMIEDRRGIAKDTVITEGDIQHESIGKYKSIIRSAANDVEGLMYAFYGKGLRGEESQKIFQDYIMDPYWEARGAINADLMNSLDYYNAALKANPSIKKRLNKKIGIKKYSVEQAIRVFNFRKSALDKANSIVNNNKEVLEVRKKALKDKLDTRRAKLSEALATKKTKLREGLETKKAKALAGLQEKVNKAKDAKEAKDAQAKLAEARIKVNEKIKESEEKYDSKVKEAEERATNKIKELVEKFETKSKELQDKANLEAKELKEGVPGLKAQDMSVADIAALVKAVQADTSLLSFAENIGQVFDGDSYVGVPSDWAKGGIRRDLSDHVKNVRSKQHLTKFRKNAAAMFSPNNMSKIEAAYGKKRRDAIDASINRMNGVNQGGRGPKAWQEFMDYINQSVATTLFYNKRSAGLQMLSVVNFVNLSFNNPLAASNARLNNKQWKADKKLLMESHFIRHRKEYNAINIELKDLNEIIERDNDGVGTWQWMKEKRAELGKHGLFMTKMMDAWAISAGGATYYRNLVKKLTKGGMELAAAEKQAMADTLKVARKTQQSSDAALTSVEQNSGLGTLVLAYANTPMQYTRTAVKAMSDIANGRGDVKENVAKATYYMFLANVAFNFIGAGANAALGFGINLVGGAFGVDNDDEEEPDYVPVDDKIAKEVAWIEKLNSLLVNAYRGFGAYGAYAAAIQTVGVEAYLQNHDKKKRDNLALALAALAVSPPIQSKIRSTYKAVDYFTSTQTFAPSLLDKPKFLDKRILGLAEGLKVANVKVYRLTNAIEELNQLATHNLTWSQKALTFLPGFNERELGIDYKYTWDQYDNLSSSAISRQEDNFEEDTEAYYEDEDERREAREKYYD